MRDIYTHGIITSDFVLVTGDLVSSIRIDEVVKAHKERRKTNKDAIMTMVVKESGAKHRTRYFRRSKCHPSILIHIQIKRGILRFYSGLWDFGVPTL